MEAGPNRSAIARQATCDLCGEHEVEVIGLRDRRGKPLATAVCTSCGLISHLRIPSDEELAKYYAEEYRRDYHGEIAPSPRRVMRAWKTGGSLLSRLRPYLNARDRVFEVGAGIGCTIKAFELAGFEAEGIEPNAGFNKFSRRILQANVSNAFLEEAPFAPLYDVVLLVHVIEHLRSPAAALRHIRQILKPDGRLYVECPNVGAPHAAPGKLYHYAHIHNFTNETLATLAQACGFQIRQQLSGEDDRNLMFVLDVAPSEKLKVRTGACRRVLERVHRYNTLTYHLRLEYLRHRLDTLASHAHDRLAASWRVRQLAAHFARFTAQRTTIGRERKAA